MKVTEAKKGSDDYLMDWADYIIGELVREKTDLVKAYNYFNGVRDHYQYENLEKNYGVGNPTSVSFTPLTRKHIEAIVGEYLTTKPQPKISCKDHATLTNIAREKQSYRSKLTRDWLSKYITNMIYTVAKGDGSDNTNQQQADYEIERELKDIDDTVERNFISNYEIAAQNIVQYVLENRNLDFYNKLEQLLLDLLIAGQAYYKVRPTHNKTNFRIEVCDPLNTWIDKDPKSRYMKHAYKAVVRKWMTPEEIEIKFGDFLSDKDMKKIRDWKNQVADDDQGDYALITGQAARCGEASHNPGIWADTNVHPYENETLESHWDMIPVYEVEWIDSAKVDGKWIGYTYQVTRIGQDIYVLDGEDSLPPPREMDSPNETRLSLNGIWYTNGHGAPYSLMLETADMQDQYDMTIYKKDNAIALSGTKGAIVDISALPDSLGQTPEERLMTYMGYRKIGFAPIDTAQEGMQSINTIYNGFDDSINVNTVQAYQVALEMIEQTVSSITGVFRERLGGIEQRDAVANVEVGMQQSYIITKRYYQAMDTLVKEMLTDCIDICKIVYRNGLTGQLILGNRKQIFELAPEYYTATSYDVNLADSGEIIKEQNEIKQMAAAYMQSNMMDPEILMIITTSKSLTEMKELTLKSIKEKKMENDQLKQLQQMLQQAQEQQQELQKQLEKSTTKIQQLNERKLAIEQQDNSVRQQIDWYKAKADAENKDRELDLIEQRNKLEVAQLYDNNPNNNEINFSKKM